MRETVDTAFVGERGELFRLALRTSVLTVLTLGIYRFWMKTRLRRYYWSSVRPGGAPLEYLGEPVEKLLGFLIAVVVLAFYLGIVNLGLMFASFSLFQSNTVAYLLSFAGVVPIWFYALYRARRYVLARTRWRGIRFALEPGAWGYAWRALWHWTLTILSLGLLWPRMTFWLEKYKTDRTWYGDQKLEQGGRWTMLFPAMRPVLLAAMAIALSGWMIWQEVPAFGILLAVALIALPFTLIHYRVKSLEILTGAKRAGALGLDFTPSTARVTRIVILGNLKAGLLIGLATTALAVVTVAGARGQDLEVLVAVGALPAWVLTAFALISYFLVFVFWGVLRHVFVLQPLWQHYAENLRVSGALALPAVAQRGRDAHREAEGFAEALDLGAAI